jgi:hypothetical protein
MVISNWTITDKNRLTTAKQGSRSGSAPGSVNQRYGSEDPHPHPAPYQNVTVPEHCCEDKNFAESDPQY